DAASLSTSIDSISDVLIELKLYSGMTTPSITSKGIAPALNDFTPLILIVDDCPGWPLALCIPSDSPEKFNPDHAFKQIRSGQSLSLAQQDNLTYHILLELGRIYSSYGWVQQFHLGP